VAVMEWEAVQHHVLVVPRASPLSATSRALCGFPFLPLLHVVPALSLNSRGLELQCGAVGGKEQAAP